MSRIFISYSSMERNEALAIQKWLEDNGWDDDVFVDVDPQFGIAGGSSWREALRAASNRCEAILLLLSRNWLASKSCWSEFVLAEKHGKPIIPIKIDPNLPDPDDLPDELTSYQIIDKANISETEFVTRLRYGLEKAGAGPENFPLMPGRPPYPGLKALTESDAALFFGRDAEVLSALDTLREIRDTGRKRIFVILGASGSGKSSLLRAGLWPRINRNDRQFLALPTIRPGNAPLTGPQGFWQALATALADERRAQHFAPSVPRTATALRMAAEQHPDAVSNVVRALQQAALTSFADPHAPVPSVVLSIDQGEELLSGEDGAESDKFLRGINQLIADIPELIVIIAIRSDEYPQLQNDERFPQDELRPFNLSAMGPAGLARVISGPANRVGLAIDPQLHSLLTRESSGADALPLLAFTLERLYTERLEPQRISLDDYRRLGGAAGAISASADVVRSRAIQSGVAPERYDALLRRVFLPHLARVNEAGEFARRIARRSDLDPASQPLVDLLIEQRLLVMDQIGEGPTLEVAHEAILREWPLLAGWLNAEKGFLEWREEVARTRKLAEAGQDDLLTGRALAVAQSFIDTREADIAEIDRKFIRDSIDAETARKQAEDAKQEAMRQAELNAAQAREEAAQTEAAAQKRIAAQAKRATRRLAALAVLLTVFAVGAAGAGVWAYMSQQEAVAATKVAQHSQKESESRRLASLASDLRGQGGDDKAMALSWLAMPHDEAMASTPITDEAASELYRRSIMPVFEIEGHIKSYFPKEGPYIASLLLDNRAILWDSETLEIVAEFEGLMDYWDGYYYRDDPIAFTQDGTRLHLIKDDQFVIFDIEERAEKVTMDLPRYETPEGEEELTHYYTASDSGSHLVASTDRGQSALYDVASGREVLDLTVGPDFVYPDELQDWGLGQGLEYYSGAFFSPDEKLLGIGYTEWKNGFLFLWEVESRRLADVIGSSGAFERIEFSPDNRFINVESASQFVEDLKATEEFVDGLDVSKAYIGSLLHDGLDKRLYSFVDVDHPYTADTPGVFHSDEFATLIPEWEDEPTPYPEDYPPVWAVDSRKIAEELGRLSPTDAYLPLMFVSIDSGHVIISGEEGECARAHNIRTGEFLGTLIAGEGECAPGALTPDGRLAFLNSCLVDEWGYFLDSECENDTTVFELTPGTPTEREYNITPIDLVTLNGGEAAIVDQAGTGFTRIDLAGRRVTGTNADQLVSVVAFDPASQSALVGDWAGGVWRYDMSDMAAMPVEIGRHGSAVSAIAISADGKSFASASHDGSVRMGTLDGGESTEASERHSATVSSLSHSAATGKWVSSSFDGTVRVWNGGASDAVDDAYDAGVYSVAHQARGDLVVSASEDSTMRLWSLNRPGEAKTLTGHEAAVRRVIWSPDETIFVSLSDDRTAKVWTADGKLKFTLSGHIDRLTRAIFSADQKLLITADRSGQVRVWDVPTGALLTAWQTDGSGVTGLAHLDEGKSLIAVTASGNLYRWRLTPGGLKERIAAVGDAVSHLRPLSARECAQYYIGSLPGADRVCRGEDEIEVAEAEPEAQP